MQRRSIRGSMAGLVAVVTVLLVVTVAAGVISVARLSMARDDLVERVDPQVTQSAQLTTALLDQDTGIRGYLLTGRSDFLSTYRDGFAAQQSATSSLLDLGATPGTPAGTDLDRVTQRATAWQNAFAQPTLINRASVTANEINNGQTAFDQVRAALGAQQNDLGQARDQASARLSDATSFLNVVLASIAVLLIILFVLLYLIFRRLFIRPVLSLAKRVRAVAGTDVELTVTGTGPRELTELAEDIEAMRQRIVDEVGELQQARGVITARSQELERANAELARSNADLEQFAYVASHDLQEPLRKVASFCQLLQRRYAAILDERGNQYIEFAVDGAQRMQVLISDLLAFSRVGQRREGFTVIDTATLARQATANLGMADKAAAQVVYQGLPKVTGEGPLLTTVFQNLIGNAIKFRGDEPPRIEVSAERTGDEWTFTVSDNGIGIDPEQADRVFVIFQRLHSRQDYPGTGIGLAMSRRIVEFHGGRIWLDTDAPGPGSTFRFTLPAMPDDDTASVSGGAAKNGGVTNGGATSGGVTNGAAQKGDKDTA